MAPGRSRRRCNGRRTGCGGSCATERSARVRLRECGSIRLMDRPLPSLAALGAGNEPMTDTGLTITERALLSGEDLSGGTIVWGRRPERPPRHALTDRDLHLMALLYGANFLSTSHLTALGWACGTALSRCCSPRAASRCGSPSRPATRWRCCSRPMPTCRGVRRARARRSGARDRQDSRDQCASGVRQRDRGAFGRALRPREKPRRSRAFLGRERRDSNPRPLP